MDHKISSTWFKEPQSFRIKKSAKYLSKLSKGMHFCSSRNVLLAMLGDSDKIRKLAVNKVVALGRLSSFHLPDENFKGEYVDVEDEDNFGVTHECGMIRG